MEQVKGDKDIDVGAGQITISSIHDGDYRSVKASVSIGEVRAQAYGADNGGFFLWQDEFKWRLSTAGPRNQWTN